ncbi:unnamed protein product [Parascedosporium putredinis]|uniref:PAS fold-3 domain-containing protein n=1 Tax=Parascedosporium putredinis TaxID=1442378 RepID=A0A9P1MCN7_9PEZI|nr:unnamed protein product [Parascedosporium putredinis]CAI8001993.1 unnamed protein product [Parascedosporium putredinis]
MGVNPPKELVDHFIKDFVHPDDVGLVLAEMNESIATGESMRIFYRFKRKDGTYVIFEAVGHAHIAAPRFAPNPLNRSPFCQAVFVMSRPYPTKSSGLLDSFLEHKMENDRLRRRIAELRAEEDAEEAESQRQWKQRRNSSRSELSHSEDSRTMASSSVSGTPLWDTRIARVAERAQRAEDALQCLRASLGKKEKKKQLSNSTNATITG